MAGGRGRQTSRHLLSTEDSSWHPSAVRVRRKIAKNSDKNTPLALDESSSLNRGANVNNHSGLNGSPDAQLAVNSRSSSEESSYESTSSLDHVNYDLLFQSVRSPAAASSPAVPSSSTSRVAKDSDKIEALTRAMPEETEAASKARKCTSEESSYEHLFREKHAAPHPFAYLIASCEQVTEGEAIETSKHEASQTDPDDSPVLDRSLSHNLTEMVNMFHGDASSDSEIESASPSLVEVSGYKVKEASAGILRGVIEKHGDIASSCILARVEHRSWLLERVCDIIATLQNRNFKDMTREDVRNQLDDVYDLKEVKMGVDWLLNRLEKIHEAKKLVKDICSYKEVRRILIQERDEAKKELEGYRAEKLELRQRLDLVEKEEKHAEEKVNHAEAEIDKINKFGLTVEPKLLCYEKRGSMVDGLL